MLGTEIPLTNERSVDSDLIDMALPFQTFIAEGLRHGRSVRWFPGAYLGLPVASVPEAMPWHPLVTPLFVLFSPARALAWVLVLHLLLAGLGASRLARHLGASDPASVLCALCVSLGLWLPEHFRQLNTVVTAAWVPWVWLALDKCLLAPSARGAARLGLCAGVMLLGNHLQIAHHSALVLSLWCVARCVSLRAWHSLGAGTYSRALTLALGLGTLLSLALSAAHLPGILEAARLADRSHGLNALSERYPEHPKYLLTLLRPRAADFLSPEVIPWEESLHIGWTPLVFCLVALLPGAKRPRGLLTALVASVLLAYGRQIPGLRHLHSLIPGMAALRFINRHLWLTSLALSLLAALGLTRAEGFFEGRARWLRPFVLAWGAVFLSAFELVRITPAMCPVGGPTALLAEPESSARLRRRGVRPERFAERVHGIGFSRRAADLTAALTWGRASRVMLEAHRRLLPQHASQWGWQTLAGDVGLAPSAARIAVYDQHVTGILGALELRFVAHRDPEDLEAWLAWCEILGARWLLFDAPVDHPRLRALGRVSGLVLSVYVYEAMAVMPGAWLAEGSVSVRDDAAAARQISLAPWTFRSQAVVHGSPARGPSARCLNPGTAQVVHSELPESFEVLVDSRCSGLLVMNHGYHPRWELSVDGGVYRAPLRVNLVQMGVLVTPGPHRVRARFNDLPERLGLFVSLVSLGVSLAMVFRRSDRSRSYLGA